MKQKKSITIILTLMLAIIDSGMLLNAEQKPSCTAQNGIAKVIKVKGYGEYKRSGTKQWIRLPMQKEKYEKIYFCRGDIVKVIKLATLEIQCTYPSKTWQIPDDNVEWGIASRCQENSNPN